MNFRSFRLTGFAQIQDVTLEFAEGAPSLIVGPNESGKSHLLKALIGTLFGLTPADVNACTPWQGEPVMCATLDFEANGERIALARRFLDERVEVIRDGETIYDGRGRTFGRLIAEDESYRELLAGWLGFSEMEIFHDLIFVEQDQLSDRRLNKQAPEIKRLITGSREASYETALNDLTVDLDKLKKLPRKRMDREIELLRQSRAELLQRIAVAEQNEAAVVDLRESELGVRSNLTEIETRRAALAELIEAHGTLVTLREQQREQSDDYQRAQRDLDAAQTSATRRQELLAEIARLRVAESPDLDTLRRTRFELDETARTAQALQAQIDALESRRDRSRPLPADAAQSPRRPRSILLIAAFAIALASLAGAATVDPRLITGLLFALVVGAAAFIFPEANGVPGPSRIQIEEQLAVQERMRLEGEREHVHHRLTDLRAHSEGWLAAANETDLASLIDRIERYQRATIKLENAPVASADEIARLQSDQHDGLMRMALIEQRIEQLEADRPELLTLTPEAVSRNRQTIERLNAQQAEIDQTLRTNEIRHGVLSQTVVDDAAALRVTLGEIDAELARKEQLAAALELAIDTLRDCVHTFQENALEPVADDAGRLLRQITGGRHQSVRLDQQTMEPAVRIGARDDIDITELSRGTRDQLYLAIRLALVDALSGGIRLPLVLDDPCVHFDAERLAATSRLLSEIARERPVIIVTKDDTYSRWFTPVLRLQTPALVTPNGVSS
jgi:DNA repair exonuclease SbcCD ATPase subunit